jgi:hypothetical protein
VERGHLAGKEVTDQLTEGVVLGGEDVALHDPTVGGARGGGYRGGRGGRRSAAADGVASGAQAVGGAGRLTGRVGAGAPG